MELPQKNDIWTIDMPEAWTSGISCWETLEDARARKSYSSRKISPNTPFIICETSTDNIVSWRHIKEREADPNPDKFFCYWEEVALEAKLVDQAVILENDL